MTTNFNRFIDAVRKVNTPEGVGHLAGQLNSYRKQPDCLMQVVALLADPDMDVVQRVIAVIGAAYLLESKVVRNGLILLIKRTDLPLVDAHGLPCAVAKVAVRALIDATLNRDEQAHDALLAFVQQGSAARTVYDHTIALYSSTSQRHKLLRQINAVKPTQGGAV